MTIVLVLQMGYMLVGDLAHEISGTAAIVLWIIHNLLHRRWYASIFRSRYPLKRTVNTIINIVLLLSVLGIIASSLIISSYVFSFLNLNVGMGFARQLHMLSVYWCFILSSLHLGIHWSRVTKIIANNIRTRRPVIVKVLLHAAAIAVSCFGIYAFIKQQLGAYMFLRVQFVFFDFEQSPLSFFFEYISIMVLFASVSFYISSLMTGIRNRRKAA